MDATKLFQNHTANLHNISEYLEQGGDPAVLCEGGWPKQKDLMEMCIQYTQGNSLKDQSLLGNMIKVAKVLVAAGLPVTQRQVDMASGVMSTMRTEEKYALPPVQHYLQRVMDGEEKPLTRKELRQCGILFDPEKAAATRNALAFKAQKNAAQEVYAMHAMARADAGLVLNEDALRADDIAPGMKLGAPLQLQGKILQADKEAQR